ncbi:S-adenosyl-L-methionine-dependent methyltransferase [Xylaria bambusicola]|uniref:S-adenosyl-L-methionine-dependent methyltransferase n=1 Tax=Xylaria bambusicola TaxID=326684 RepID=UPI0020073B64|nr:S-adenosyl-L-methionine-dependent methyltransferase [Xylaria bambusicola]KAI0509717.1 S-adenosyl-L-methionine-dependent methyltransferase [Xylaria bambusicola]
MGSDEDPAARLRMEWDVDAEETPQEPQAAAIEKRLKDQAIRFRKGLIRCNFGSDGGEQQDDPETVADIEGIIDLTTEVPATHQRCESHNARNPPIPSEVLLDHYIFGNSKLQPGLTVQIKTLQGDQLYKASFLYIKHIIDTPDGIKLRGIPLTRMRYLRGLVPRFRNEVAMIRHVDNDDKRPEEIQGAMDVPIADVIRTRNCHFTNADFPQFRTVIGVYSSIAKLEQKGVLMCRWKCTFIYRDSATRIAHMNKTRKNAAPFEFSIEHVTAKEASRKRFIVSESGRFNAWRGGKVRGGEYDSQNEDSPFKSPVVKVDGKEDSEQVMIAKKPGQRYTFGDIFCGAGGASLGAQKAGFRVKVACDHHAGACLTYEGAFPEADLHMIDIYDFIVKIAKDIRVDVLHLSPPCQYWSPAHTVEGVNDEANVAALFSCHELIKRLKPRLFTLEQTFGLLHPRFEWYFNALIHGFTANNYSVRWKIVDLVNWGCPATRRRLLIIGSCPGEELPTFPKATHAAPDVKKRGRKPHVTVKKMLARIPRNASQYDDMHQPHAMVRKYLERWDPDVTLTRCITTNGGVGNYHPNGRRDFTLREYATLQTFPVDYPFKNPDRKKQVGNAFPPMAVKVLYTHLRKWLEKKDRVYAIENEPVDLDDPDVELLDLEDDFVDEGTTGSDDEDCKYMGSQQLSSSSRSTGASQEDMDLDASDGDYILVPCIDMNQRRRLRPAVELPQDSYMDLTVDDD